MTCFARLAASAIAPILASILLAGPALAQTAPAAVPAPKAATPMTSTPMTSSPTPASPAASTPAAPNPAADPTAGLDKQAKRAISVACSKEADDQGLKGKARGKFRSACKKEKSAAPAPAG